ncbi:hypothetical protein ADIARSV_1297 [Arcticibacter svalbardensis MN12-7]|uniref:Anti-sigma factor n=1 Tax=Arcticibacter svalbardensis MN12-7 TaxID=1150600 RepID=R9GUW0_9SPHI|nr:FecR domain-containing protein [Arcticibacter svalbardensis]EOR95478.1 hypothetical protein ADIARSV_1297 [Arcticibacter svalbardensis MN12-7]
MQENKEFLEKIVKHLNNPEDKLLLEEIEAQKNASEANLDLYNQIVYLWNLAPEVRSLNAVDVEQATARLSLRLKKEKRFKYTYWLRNVAAIVLLLGAAYWIYSASSKVIYLEKTAKNGVDSITLQDSTKIYLSEGSSIKYPNKLNEAVRKVYLLRGEAFFKVTPNKTHPFVVDIKSSRITVLGTSFNIRNTDGKIALNVKTGKVKFELANGSNTSILIAGEGLLYDFIKRKTIRYQDKTGSTFAWLTHELNFVDAPLSEVFSSLENYYHIRFQIQDSLSSYNKFNARFKDNTIDEVLAIIKETYPLTINQKDSIIIIKNK